MSGAGSFIDDAEQRVRWEGFQWTAENARKAERRLDTSDGMTWRRQLIRSCVVARRLEPRLALSAWNATLPFKAVRPAARALRQLSAV